MYHTLSQYLKPWNTTQAVHHLKNMESLAQRVAIAEKKKNLQRMEKQKNVFAVLYEKGSWHAYMSTSYLVDVYGSR